MKTTLETAPGFRFGKQLETGNAGTFKKCARSVRFFDTAGNLFAAAISNRFGEQFVVSASMLNGKAWFSFALGDADARKLGVATYPTTATANAVWNQFNN